MKVGKWIDQKQKMDDLVKFIQTPPNADQKEPYSKEGSEYIDRWYKACYKLFKLALESEYPKQSPGYMVIALRERA